MKNKDIINYLLQFFPLESAYNWDNCGLQIGDLQNSVSKIMIALTPDLNVVNECIENGVSLLITHHPLFFSSLKQIDFNSDIGKVIKLAVEYNITIYSLHTCMDCSEILSLNDWLIEEIGFDNYITHSDESLIKITETKIEFDDLITNIKNKLLLETVRYCGNRNDVINKIAVIGGSGSEYISLLSNNVDCLITGDLKYHDYQLALSHNLKLIDIGHFAESIMVRKTIELINKEFNLTVLGSEQTDYIKIKI